MTTTLGQRVLEMVKQKPLFPSFDRLWNKDVSRQFITHMNTSPIAINQEKVTKSRSLIQRYDAPKVNYFDFLRNLYPMEPHVHFETLYQSYLALPTPQPLFIQHEHLEHLLRQFNKAAGENRHIVSRYYEKIQSDMRRSQMEISEKERNSLLALKFYNQRKVQPIDEAYEQLIKTTGGNVDISTINIFLKHAVRLQSPSFINKITQDIKTLPVSKPDRITLGTLFSYSLSTKDIEKTEEIFNQLISSRISVDITLMNAILNNLIASGDLNSATKILSVILESKPSQHPLLIQKDNKTKRQYMRVSSFIDSLKLQTDDKLLYPLTPSYDTFSPFLNHFVELETFDPKMIAQLLQFITKLELRIPTSMLMRILNVFKDHKMQESESMRKVLELLQDQGIKHVKYHHKLVENVIGASIKQKDSKVSNDFNEKWDKLETVSKRRNWKEVDIKKLASDLVDEVAVAH